MQYKKKRLVIVHKRYVKRSGKLYGPYFYESFRDKDGNVRNHYLGNEPKKVNKKAHQKTALNIPLIAISIALLILILNTAEITGLTTKQSGTTNQTILDDTEINSYYSNKSTQPSMVAFTANYTDTVTGSSITGNCTIAFNTTGTFTDHFQMSYNQTGFTGSYRYNYSFDRRGTFQFNVSCNATGYANLSSIDSFTITNSYPVVSAYPGNLPPQTCQEDTACTYNYSLNVTDYDVNDIPITNFTLLFPFNCLSINSTSGLATVNCTTDTDAGTYSTASLVAVDGAGGSVSKLQIWTVSPVNDAPTFNTTNWNVSATQDIFFSYKITASDEENGSYPYLRYSINATYTWLNGSSINSTTGNISFLPSNSEVGVYHINVTVNDTTGLSTSQDLQININDVNDAPNLTIACSPNLTAITTEEALFECWINATDVDAGETVTFSANYSFLALNGSAITVEGGKAGVLLNLTPTDANVGTRWVNFTVTDSQGLKDSALLNFTILNFEEWPYFTNISNNISAYANTLLYYNIDAADNDSNTPQGTTLQYTDNTTLFDININTGVISFIPTNASGTHWVNITVNDSTDRSTSYIVNVTINPNTAPVFTANGNISMTESTLFYYNMSVNFTDVEGNNYTFIDNTTFFDIGIYGNITLNATELDVGVHWVIINATDVYGATSSYTMNFTVYNVNEPPLLFTVDGRNYTEGNTINFNVSANDSDLLNSANNENLTFSFNYSWITFTKSNSTTARIYFTAGAASAGNFTVNVTVNDTAGNQASGTFYLNILESQGYPQFTYVCDNNRTAIEDQRITCSINATDTDAGASLTFSANYSWFLLNGSAITIDESNTASSLVNFTPVYTGVGNFSVNISVTDGVFINTTVISFNVSSVNDQPNITTRGPAVVYTQHSLRYDVNATDEEDGNDALTGNLTFVTNDSRFSIDKAGILEFSPNTTQNGTYWVNVTVNDTSGYGFSSVLNITVYTDNAPTCSAILRGGVPTTPPSNFTMVENDSTGNFITTCTDLEGDTIYYYWFWNGTLNASGTTASTWNYTASLSDRGNKNITFIVGDNVYNTTYYWNVTVYELNVAPQMYKDIPNITSGWFQNSDRGISLTEYFYDSNNDALTYDWYYYATNESFDSISSKWQVIQGTWNVSNNVTNYFYNQSSTSGDTYVTYGTSNYENITSLELKIRAYGTKTAGVCFKAQESNCNNSYRAYIDGTNSKLTFDVYQSGTATSTNNSQSLTINNDVWYWLKVKAKTNIIEVYYSNNSVNYTLAYNTTNSTYTNGKILLFTSSTRADFDDVVMKTYNIPNFTLSLNTSTSNLSFSPLADWWGEVPMRITASDGNRTRESNIFYLTVYHATPGTETTTVTQQSAGGTTSFTQTASLDIIVPSMLTIDQLTTTLVPIVLNNSGEVALNLLKLTAFTNSSQFKLKFDKNNWEILGVGEKVTATLEIEAGALSPERYVIELAGVSKSPRLRQTAKINVDVRERQAALKTQLKENIQFTRDLFLQNPECLELTELLDRAEEKYDEGEYQEGLDLVKTANEGCKNFIAQKERRVIAAAKNFLRDNWKVLTAEALGLVLMILLIIYHLKRRKFKQKPTFE